MFLENVSGFAERILRNFDISRRTRAGDFVERLHIVPIEIAEGFKQRGVPVASIISRRHSEASASKHPRGIKLQDVSDLVLDTGASPGDAMVKIDGLDTPVRRARRWRLPADQRNQSRSRRAPDPRRRAPASS